MKRFKQLSTVLAFIAILTCNSVVVTAQKKPSSKEAAIKNLVDSQRYVFYAQSVTPSSGRQRFLTSDYTVYVSKDTVNSELPYFGRAYSVSIGSTDGGIKFTSVDFDYNSFIRKKGGWEIRIKPKDGLDVQQMNLTIYNNGTAYLFVNSNNRQSISFNGYIAQKKK